MNSSEPIMTPATSAARKGPPLIFAYGLPLFLVTCIFFVRLWGPSNLVDNDQERPAAYIHDALDNGNWIVMVDQSGDVMSKPPLSTWITAVLALPFDDFTLFNLYLPSVLAVMFQLILILKVGEKHFGRMAAFIAAFALVISSVGFKQVALARTDPIFSALTFACALAGFRAWTTGRSWWPFWLLAALSTLTKGPLGPILALFGLAAAFWERDVPRRGDRLWWSPRVHILPVLVFVGICALWFFLAWMQLGDALIQKMFYKELAGHVVEAENSIPAASFYVPPFYFLTRFAPWSLFAYWGIFRAFRSPAANPTERKFERFLIAYFLLGLTIFALVPHQRSDLLWPLIPAGALLAGREVERFFGTSRRKIPLFLTLTGLGLLMVMPFYAWGMRQAKLGSRQTKQVREFVEKVDNVLQGQTHDLIKAGKIKFYECPYGIQFHFGTMSIQIEDDEAAQLLKQGDTLIITRDVYDIYDFIPYEERPHEIINVEFDGRKTPLTLVSPTRDPLEVAR